MEKIFKNKLILIGVIVLIILAVFVFVKSSKGYFSERRLDGFSQKLNQGVIDDVESESRKIPDEKEVYERVQEKCPYYKPDGARYRGCLYEVLDQSDAKATQEYNALLKDLKIVMAEAFARSGDELINSPAKAFLESVPKFQASWKSYKDAYCEVDNAIFWGGSDQGGMIAMCLIYMDEVQLAKYASFRRDWVEPMIRDDFENKHTPKTPEYKALFESGYRKI